MLRCGVDAGVGRLATWHQVSLWQRRTRQAANCCRIRRCSFCLERAGFLKGWVILRQLGRYEDPNADLSSLFHFVVITNLGHTEGKLKMALNYRCQRSTWQQQWQLQHDSYSNPAISLCQQFLFMVTLMSLRPPPYPLLSRLPSWFLCNILSYLHMQPLSFFLSVWMYPDSTAQGQLTDLDQLCVCQFTSVPGY